MQNKTVKWAKALADETRARILGILLHYELSVGEIVGVLDMSQPRVSRHLKILAQAGLLIHRKDGLLSLYKAAQDANAGKFVQCLAPFLEKEPGHDLDLDRAKAVVAERDKAARRFFDTVAGHWDQVQTEVLGDTDLPGLVAALLPENKVVADLGCGPGRMIKLAAPLSELVIGVDNSPKMLQQAEANLDGTENVSLRLGRLDHLPLRDNEADAAILSLVLHHLEHPEKAVKEAARVVTSGGKMIIAEFDRHQNEKMRTRFKDRWLGIAPEEISVWVSETGFAKVKKTVVPVNMGLSVIIYECWKQ